MFFLHVPPAIRTDIAAGLNLNRTQSRTFNVCNNYVGIWNTLWSKRGNIAAPQKLCHYMMFSSGTE